ncbi:MAG: polyamine aminopropyltransferase [Armatimonas sp.]
MPPLSSETEKREALALLATVFIVAACGLIYELLTATISSYLLGSSVTQFSLCIGTFIGAMGLGSWASQHIEKGLLRVFLVTEVALAMVGGLSAWALHAAYAFWGDGYYFVLFGTLILLGGLVGLELPVLTRLLSGYGTLKNILAAALSFDYIGSLAGSILFPLLLLPMLGATRTAFLVGLLNLGVAGWNVVTFKEKVPRPFYPLAIIGVLGALLFTGFITADKATGFFERALYEDSVLLAKQTPYQRIVITRRKNDLRLYLDGNIQFSAADEYRYHEPLIHPAMSLSVSRENILVLGGGDGLAVREILKWPDVKSITLVDIDPAMTDLAKTYPALRELNNNSFSDPRVKIVHEDAYKFLEKDPTRYGVIIGDLPDPNNEALGKLYSKEFYKFVRERLGRGGVLVVQSTSPLFARDAFWCTRKTIASAGFNTTPYHVYVPTFGDWGFTLARATPEPAPDLTKTKLTGLKLRFLQSANLATLTAFDADTSEPLVEISTLDHPRILNYYETETKRWE